MAKSCLTVGVDMVGLDITLDMFKNTKAMLEDERIPEEIRKEYSDKFKDILALYEREYIL